MAAAQERCDHNEDVEEDSFYQESSGAENAEEANETEGLRNEMIQLSESIFIYQNKAISDHGNVFEGEIRSGVYGVRVCAIKIDRKSDQIVTEAKLLTKLGSHTHVISIIQSGIYEDMFEDRVFIALDKCHEQNLHQHVTHQKDSGLEFNLNEALDYSKQMIAGVTYVHENLIIHKDLKPSNILLSHDKSTIKIADFGLSQEIKSTSSKVYSKHQFGTNGFRPIESFGDNWVSLKSDIFSLGAVLYFVLSHGKSPFGDEIFLLTHNTKNGVIDLSNLLVPNRSPFQHLIALMFSKERCCRPSIRQVAGHPCWTEEKVECNFAYGFTDETDDSDLNIAEQRSPESIRTSKSESEMASLRQLLKDLRDTGIIISPYSSKSIIIFDRKSAHLQRLSLSNISLTQMHGFKEDMKGSSTRFSAVFLGSHIYILIKRSMYRIEHGDVAARWEQMADLINEHGQQPPAIVVSGKIYVAGVRGGPRSNVASKYDPSLNRWGKLAERSLKTCGTAHVASKGHVYSIGGDAAEAIYATNRVERLNVDSETWDEVKPMQEPRWEATAVECNGNVIVAGGVNHSGKILNSVEKYDSDRNQWTFMKPMLKARFTFRCHFIEGTIYAVSGAVPTIEKYDFNKEEWELLDNLEIDGDLDGMDICGSVVVK